MQSRPLVIVTTRLPPQVCGIGTFSWLLHRHWPGDTSGQRFLVVDVNDKSGIESEREAITEFGNDWKTLANALERNPFADVLLHYAGRAYQPLGCPIGLVSVFRNWKRKFPDARLIVFFHELPGRLPLSSRHFWLNIFSRRLAGRLAMMADLVITNTREHARTLEEISGHKDVRCLPVPSNIENTVNGDTKRNRTEFVIFGLPYGRWQTLQTFDQEIRAWQESGALTKLHLIGPLDDKFDARSQALLKSYPRSDVVIQHGEVPPDQISQLLSEAQFALTTANELTWSKSATFMAFLAHGCTVVVKSRSDLEPLSWAITAEEVGTCTDDELQAKARAAKNWYETNADWKILGREVSDLISRMP
jgi:hypothetical protein